MKADIKWLDDPEVFRVNRLNAHSDHNFYGSREEMERQESSFYQSLDGIWRFHYSVNAASRPEEFFREDYDFKDFGEIDVPGHIELAGYDRIHYINTMYPWDGQIFRRPAYTSGDSAEGSFSRAEYNPVGSYVRRFDLDEGLKGKRVCICFEGVEEAMYVWLNGTFIGYAEDSFTPSEFDLTPYVRESGNLLAVEVHKRSTAAFLEDQDFFRFFGIFRSVTLRGEPEIHLRDFWAKPVLHEDNRSGAFELEAEIWNTSGPGSMELKLTDREGRECLSRSLPLRGPDGEENVEKLRLPPQEIDHVIPWENADPCLYTLTAALYNEKGELLEIAPCRVGFRRIEIVDKVMKLNGKRLIFNGVNRHEWSAETGRCIGREEMEWDMECLLRNHINAVRTCHYPDQIPWYRMCDENGIYVMAEVNLESHGSWQKMGAVEPSWNVPGSNPRWREAVLDRAVTNFETFKNHPSVLIWSVGNESYAEESIESMNRYYKERDPGRLVHYEGVFHNRAYEDTVSDLESRMYATPSEAEEYLKRSAKKPYILCEFMHDMGNSMGGLKSYMDLIDRYEMYHGGFIWDFIDQALFVKDEVTGKPVLRYGGDFDDRPSDYEFSGNGIVFADRTEKPAMQEVRYYYGLYR